MLYGSWTFVLIWLSFIFCLSSQPAPKSDSLSKSITRVIVKGSNQIQGTNPSETQPSVINKLNNKIRDYAHATVFMVLGVLLTNALYMSRIKRVPVWLFAFLICAVYAVSDEFHQMFVPGRGRQMTDFLLDCAGALVGIGIYLTLFKSVVLLKKHQNEGV